MPLYDAIASGVADYRWLMRRMSFEEEVGGDLQRFGADLVDGVLRGVVVAVGGLVGVGAVVDVDEVEDGNAALLERDVIVVRGPGLVLEDVGGVAGVFCGDYEEVLRARGWSWSSRSMLRSLSPIMSATRKALILLSVPSAYHLAARWRVP